MDDCHPAGTLLVSPAQAEDIKTASLNFKSYSLEPRQVCDLELLLSGAYAPLTGYLGREDFESVLGTMRLSDGRPWAMPVSLDIPEGLAGRLSVGERLALRDGEGFMVAVLTVGEVFVADPEQVAQAVFDVADVAAHPGAAAFARQAHPCRLGGRIEGLALPGHCDYTDLRRLPGALRADLAKWGWRKVLGVQAEPFPHRRDRAEMLDAAMRTGASVLLLHPAADALAPGAEHFAAVRCAGHFAATFPRSSLTLALLPYWPLGAGPRQVLHEALIHKNYGCTHFLVAPDQADPLARSGGEPCYPLGAAQRLVAAFADEIGLAMVAARPMVYVEDRAQYEPAQGVEPGRAVRTLAPEEVGRRLEFGLDIPDWFNFPEIVSELRRAFPPRSQQGITLFMTGLSGAGKSTLAKLLYVKFMELRTRPVTLLDGDIVRRHLSSELTFSKAHRNLNIERIGYVASEITKNGGIAICAPIAPYASSRARARELVSRFGGFVEIHVATPLGVCEQRDRKGLYAKARAGVLTGVTGIDDPYEAPVEPEIVLDTATLSPGEAVQEVLLYLERQGYLA
jgi:sulfate adenylyltransferase